MKTISEERLMEMKGDLDNIELQFKYLKSNGGWEPYKYTHFVEKIEKMIETLKRIVQEIPVELEIEKKSELENRIDNLLKQYLNLWENEYK